MKTFEWVMTAFALLMLILANIAQYNGEYMESVSIFSNGAFLYAFFTWIEFRVERLKHKELHND